MLHAVEIWGQSYSLILAKVVYKFLYQAKNEGHYIGTFMSMYLCTSVRMNMYLHRISQVQNVVLKCVKTIFMTPTDVSHSHHHNEIWSDFPRLCLVLLANGVNWTGKNQVYVHIQYLLQWWRWRYWTRFNCLRDSSHHHQFEKPKYYWHLLILLFGILNVVIFTSFLSLVVMSGAEQ